MDTPSVCMSRRTECIVYSVNVMSSTSSTAKDDSHAVQKPLRHSNGGCRKEAFLELSKCSTRRDRPAKFLP